MGVGGEDGVVELFLFLLLLVLLLFLLFLLVVFFFSLLCLLVSFLLSFSTGVSIKGAVPFSKNCSFCVKGNHPSTKPFAVPFPVAVAVAATAPGKKANTDTTIPPPQRTKTQRHKDTKTQRHKDTKTTTQGQCYPSSTSSHTHTPLTRDGNAPQKVIAVRRHILSILVLLATASP